MGEEGSWQQEVRRIAKKTVREVVKKERKKRKKEGKKTKKQLRTGFLPQYLGHPSQDLVVRKLVGERRRWGGGEKTGEQCKKVNDLFLSPLLAGRTPAPHVRGPCVL